MNPLMKSLGHKPRTGKVLTCPQCKKEFYKKPSDKTAKYCSKICYGLGQRNRLTMTCKVCGKEYQRSASQVKWRGTGFCSRACSPGYIRLTRMGEKSSVWKGDKVGYDALHRWIRKTKGEAKYCEVCGLDEIPEGYQRYFQWANLDGRYTRDLTTWKRLCLKCHAEYDKKRDKIPGRTLARSRNKKGWRKVRLLPKV
jgi:endogenous inhibitor of DNA gyrase (YacG/DUF329 family)